MAASAAAFAEHEQIITERLRQAPPGEPAPPRWTLARLREAVEELHDYTLSGVWRIMQRIGVGWRRGRIRQFSPDPDYEAKEAYLLEGLQQTASHPDTHVLLFLDEMGFYRWPTPSADWMRSAPEAVRAVPCADNNRQWRILGVLNALTGQANYLDHYIVGRKVVAQIYPALDQWYPDAQHIFVVQDNWSIHKHEEVMASVAQFPHIEPVWLPTYAHWLNPIEKLWRWLRQAVLHLQRYAADWSALLDAVHTFLDQFADGSSELLRYVGLLGDGKLASALRIA